MKRKVIIVGAGETGREFAKRLARTWEVVAVDQSSEALSNIKAAGLFQGDGTSRLVLERAGAAGAAALVACTDDEEANIEACRVGSALGVGRLVGLVMSERARQTLDREGFEPLHRAALIASALENRLEGGMMRVHDVGGGGGEIVEVTVLKGSSSAGLPLREFKPKRWLVGGVYREGRFLVPHGDTVLRESDRVLLIGDSDIIPGIAEMFRSGMPRFPLQFGTRVLVVLSPGLEEGSYLEEALYCVSNTRAEDVDFLHFNPKRRGAKERLVERVRVRLAEGDYGLLVIPPSKPSWLGRLGAARGMVSRILDASDVPVLVPRGTKPYRRILFLVSEETTNLATETASDLVRTLSAHLHLLTVKSPSFIASRDAGERAEAALKEVSEHASLYRLPTTIHRGEGNPVKVVRKRAKGFDLLVIGHNPANRGGLLRPDVSRLLAWGAPVSTLVVQGAKR